MVFFYKKWKKYFEIQLTSSSSSSGSSRICLIAVRFQLFIAFTERKK